MGSVIIELLPLIVGAVAVPVWIIIVLLLISAKGGVAKASAFILGSILVRLAQGVLFGFVLRRETEVDGPAGPSIVASTLLLVLGLLMLVTAYKKWRKEDDPDAPPPKWMAMLSDVSPGKALGMGALLTLIAVKHWVFTLSAIATISAAALGQGPSIALYLFYTLGAASLMLLSVLISLIAPARAEKLLGSARLWLERNNRAILIAVSLIFGALFLVKGITGLMN